MFSPFSQNDNIGKWSEFSEKFLKIDLLTLPRLILRRRNRGF